MQQVSSSDWLLQLMDHRNFLPAAGITLGAVAIIAFATVIIVVTKLSLSHRQRIAMIARGMHPDAMLMEMVDEPTSDLGSGAAARPNGGES